MHKKLTKTLLLASVILWSCTKKTPEVTYSKVSISKLTILNFPETNGGTYWDNPLNGNYADVYFKIRIAGTTVSLYDLPVGSCYVNLKLTDLPAGWGNSGFFTLNNLNQQIDIDLIDYDYLSGSEYMSTATFDFSNYTTGSNKYPGTITITNGSTTVKLEISWFN